jgi:pilus assembly protein CpaB
MSATRIIVLVIAIVAAGAAAFLAKGLLGGSNKEAAAAPSAVAMTEVLVAASAITLGHNVAAVDLKWQRWPQEAVAEGMITRGNNPGALEETVGTIARAPMLPGEPVTMQKVVHSDGGSYMAAALTPGMRAISVEITAATGAGGFILPNDRVDVVLTRKIPNPNGGPEIFISEIILTNIRVLAIDQTLGDAEDKQSMLGQTATLEVLPAEAEILMQGTGAGVISLALRSLVAPNGASAATEPRIPARSAGTTGNDDTDTVVIIRYGIPGQLALREGSGAAAEITPPKVHVQ